MFLSLIRKRRSIRKYLNQKVENEKIALLVEAALRPPSSMGSNPWEFIVVKDPALLQKLAQTKPHGSAFLKNAPLAIVVCADAAKSSVWIEDASIASIFIQLAAESLDLGSCWIQIRDRAHSESKSAEAYISELLNIPSHLKVESIIAVGYPDEKKPAHLKEELKHEKVFLNSYGNDYPGL